MKKEILGEIKKILPEIKTNIPLKKYTTFKIGGPARYFYITKTKKDLIKAILVAKKFKLPFFILGKGGNLLVSDKGYNGIVIKIQNTKYEIQNKKIKSEAGVMLGKLINAATEVGLSGLEWAIGIPGTIGGAIYGNAGAFGKSIGDLVKEVEVFDLKEEKIKIFKKKNCHFDYRESIFKKNKNLIILSAIFQLKKRNKKEIREKIKKYLNYRRETQPLELPSAGSIFKNPQGFSAGKLIEKCGLKGKRIGNVKISEKHANFILNLGNGKAKDVKKLIELIKKKVKERFKIKLEEEIQYLGFQN